MIEAMEKTQQLKLELYDTQWPFTYTDHDRQIVRAIVIDHAGWFYFVRAVRDDDFGKATLIETSGGGVEPGEDLRDAIKRELREELGIIAGPGELDYVGSFHIRYEKVFHGLLFKDNEVTKVYLYALPVDIRELVLQKSEVDEVRWFDLDEVWDEIQLSRDRFCVPTAVLGFSVNI